MSAPPRPVELLAPAGDERALRAALAAGADAVYFGLERWSARAFAGNFAGAQAVRAVELAHLYGAAGVPRPQHAAQGRRGRAGADGAGSAVRRRPRRPHRRRPGLRALVRERFPDLPLHASTQLNTHSSSQLAALARLGFRRAILARELSLDEIAALDAHGLELEAFVHGALCYGYSGDCLLSSMVGGRSGNRGRCSQSCRMRYRLGRPGGAKGAVPAPPSAGARRARGCRRPPALSGRARRGLRPRALHRRPLRHRRASRPAGGRRLLAQDRGPHEGRRPTWR